MTVAGRLAKALLAPPADKAPVRVPAADLLIDPPPDFEATLLGYGDRSLKSQLRQAGAMGVRYALILGEEELAASSVALRDLMRGEQWLVSLDGALEALDGDRAARDGAAETGR